MSFIHPVSSFLHNLSPSPPPLFTSYTTAESATLPFSDYRYMDNQNHSSLFHLLATKLSQIDTKFFLNLATHERKSYIFQVEITYNLNLAKLVGMDFAAFPELRKVSADELTQIQRDDFIAARRNINLQPAKLVSDCRTTIITQHVDSLLYLLVWFSASIVRVKSCVEFKTYPFLTAYCHDMARKRAESPSLIQRKVTKSYTNSLAGESHFCFLDVSSHLYKRLCPPARRPTTLLWLCLLTRHSHARSHTHRTPAFHILIPPFTPFFQPFETGRTPTYAYRKFFAEQGYHFSIPIQSEDREF